MKRIITLVRKHLVLHYHQPFFKYWIAFLIIGLYVNYGMGLWNPDGLLSVEEAGFLYIFALFSTLAILEFSGIILLRPILNTHFIGFFVLCIGVLVINDSVYMQFWVVPADAIPLAIWNWFHQSAYNIQSIILYLGAPFLYAYLFEKEVLTSSYYGLIKTKFDMNPYWVMLAMMFPLIVWASYQPTFLEVYPRYRPSEAESYLGVSAWVTVGIYEITYILQFIGIEVFFRGFFVWTLSRWLGVYAVFPMVSCYMVLHFGKPLAECIGSVLGGYVLGIIAYETKSVWGGIGLHIGIALLMELTAWKQILF